MSTDGQPFIIIDDYVYKRGTSGKSECCVAVYLL